MDEIIKYLKKVSDVSSRRAAYAIFVNESGRGVSGVNNNYIGLQTDGGGFIPNDADYVKGTTSTVDSGDNCRAFATYESWQRCVDHLVAIMASRKQSTASTRRMVPNNPNDADYFGEGYAKNWVADNSSETARQGRALYNEAISKGL